MKHRSRLGVAALVAALGTTTCNDVSVTAVDVARIEISPNAAVVQVAGTVTLTARVLSQEGRALSGRTVSWRATDGQIALVDANGTVTGIGTGSTHVHATSSGVADSVLVTVEPRDPRIGLEPAVLTFDAVRGEAGPPVQGVEITNAGGGVLDGLAVTVTYPGGQAGGWITTELSGGVAPATLSVGVDVGALAPGTYTGTVSVASGAAGNSPQAVAVMLELVDAEPAIGTGTTSASFAASVGGANPAAASINVTNSGGGTLRDLTAVVSYPAGQPTGWLNATLAATTAPTALVLNATTGALGVGTHTASVQIVSDVATNSPVTIGATFVVSDVAPGVPSNLNADVVSPTRVDIAWQEPAGTVSDYRIQRRTGAGAWLEIERVAGSVLAFQSTGLAAATQYSWRVIACNAVACSAPSNEATATTFPAPPGAPGALTATAVSPSEIALSWSAPTGSIDEYRVERSVAGESAFTLIAMLPGTLRAYDDSGLAAATGYTYRVQACNAGGCSGYSNEASATTQPNAPAAPGSLTATTTSSTAISLSWDAAAGTVSEYRIERRTGGGVFAPLRSVSGTATSSNDTGLTPSTAYDYRVQACNAGGCSAFSGEASATTHPATSDAPDNLTATTVSSSRIDLSWGAAAGTVTGYEVERRATAGGAFATVATVTGTTYQDEGLAAATGYTYRVRACNAGGCSAYSNQASATTLPAAPGIPGDLTATTASPSRIDLSWTASTGTVSGYVIERRTGAGAYAVVDTVSGATAFQNDGLAAATAYTYRVQACNAGGCSEFSGEASAETHPSPPAAPGPLSATTVSSTAIDLEWGAATGTVTEYRIERRTGGSAFALLRTVPGTVTSSNDTGLTPSTAYSYRVQACNAGGCSGFSGEASATTHPATSGAPENLTATTISSSRIDLSWGAAAGTVTSYEIERRTGAGAFSLVTTVAGTTYQDDGLAAATNYTYRVRACNAGGCSAFSNEADATTHPAVPGVPGSLAAVAASSSRIDLSWTASTGTVSGYVIERRTGAGAYAVVDTVSGATAFQNDGLAAATAYTYRVQACNAGGCSAFSNEASATTQPNPPGSPGSPSATTVSSTAIDLSWGAAAGTVTGYEIERRTGAGAFSLVTTVAGTTYQDDGLAAATNYTYRVRACNAGGCSAFSNEASATTLPAAPGIPGDLTATTASSSRIDLSWTASTGTVSGYVIERRTGADAYAVVDTVSGVTAFQNDGLAAATAYTYRVQACNAGGCSEFSGEASATTQPNPPGSPSATTVSSTAIDLSWGAAAGTVTGYEIERRTGADAFSLVTTVAGTTYQDDGLAAATNYTYRVRACNAGGCSAFSNEASATTLPAAPGIPGDLTATTASSSRIDLSWTASTGTVSGYVIERRTGAGAYAVVDTVSGVTAFQNDGLAAATAYTYRVQACNAGGCSAFSGEASAETHPNPPGTPDSLSATTASSTAIDLSWDAATGTVDEYRIERQTEGGAFALHETVPGTETSLSDTGLTPGTTYGYRVQACNAGGCSAFSNEADATTQPEPPGEPGSPGATSASSTGIGRHETM